MNKDSRIYVAGHTGLVGSAIVRKLVQEGYKNIIIPNWRIDLRRQEDTEQFIKHTKPTHVLICAGKVGGIMANNTQRAEFIYDNLMIQTNIIHAAYENGVEKLLALGSACIYPRDNDGSPIEEDRLLTGKLEPTNEPYAISKIAALKTCDAYRDQYGFNAISIMPTNTYGPNDSYDFVKAHVPPALIRKFIVAKRDGTDVTIWGDGTPRREFMYVDDMAEACLFLMQKYNEPGHINVGTGVDIEINELAETIADVIGFDGKILRDTSKPNGMPRRVMDVSKINAMGWKAKTSLREGLEKTIKDIYQTNKHAGW